MIDYSAYKIKGKIPITVKLKIPIFKDEPGFLYTNRFEHYPMSISGAVKASKKLEIPKAASEIISAQVAFYKSLPSDFQEFISKEMPDEKNRGTVFEPALTLIHRLEKNGHLGISFPAIHENDKYLVRIFRELLVKPFQEAVAIDLNKVVEKVRNADVNFARYSMDGRFGSHDPLLPLLFYANLLNSGSPNSEFLPVIKILESKIAKEYGITLN